MQKFSPKWPKLAPGPAYLCLVIFTPFHYRVLTLRHTLGCKLHLFPPFNPLTAPGGGRRQPRVLDEETRGARGKASCPESSAKPASALSAV